MLRTIPLAALLLLCAACAGPTQSQVQFAQERHACAELGLDPGSSGFSGCVTNLDATMFEENNHAYH